MSQVNLLEAFEGMEYHLDQGNGDYLIHFDDSELCEFWYQEMSQCRIWTVWTDKYGRNLNEIRQAEAELNAGSVQYMLISYEHEHPYRVYLILRRDINLKLRRAASKLVEATK